MKQLVVKNRTSMTDLENFLKIVCFLHKYLIRAQAIQISNGDYKAVSDNNEEIIIELALELEIDSSDYLGFITSVFELFSLLYNRENLYDCSLAKYYYENFNPTDYDFIGQSKMKAYRKRKRKQLSAEANKAVIVQVSEDIQYVLANMEILDSLPNNLYKDLAEHNCIVRNEIDFKIAYIELSVVFVQTAVSSNLYWIEGDSIDPEQAILKETIGCSLKLFESSVEQDKNLGSKRAA